MVHQGWQEHGKASLLELSKKVRVWWLFTVCFTVNALLISCHLIYRRQLKLLISLKLRLWTHMYSDFGREHNFIHVLYHSEVSCMSRGKVSQWLLGLRTETEIIHWPTNAQIKVTDVSSLSCRYVCWAKLLEHLSARLLLYIDSAFQKQLTFKGKLRFWMNKIKSGKTAYFHLWSYLWRIKDFLSAKTLMKNMYPSQLESLIMAVKLKTCLMKPQTLGRYSSLSRSTTVIHFITISRD